MKDKQLIIIGYSGHSYVCIENAQLTGWSIKGYCELEKAEFNPYELDYLGSEKEDQVSGMLKHFSYFVCLGNNKIRRKIIEQFGIETLATLIHPQSIISKKVDLGQGTLIGAGAIINPLTKIGVGVICNTKCVIEHDCLIGDFTHIAPGATLCGNVLIGKGTFVGGGAVVKENIKIGSDCTIGAGAVVIRDVPNGQTVVGNPAKSIEIK